MILDTLQNAKNYNGLHAGIDTVLEEFKKYTPENYPSGKLQLDGDNLFMIFNNYETHSYKGALAEAHEQYIDVMYMVEGCETICVKPVDQLRNVTKAYNPEIDALLAETDPDATFVHLEAGSFIVLFPQDAHSPGCHIDTPSSVKKIVAKVRI